MRGRVALIAAAVRSISYGDRLGDKLAIAARVMVAALFPIGILARRIGWSLGDPSSRLGSYRVRSAAGVFDCPPGPGAFFLAADRTYDSAVLALIDEFDFGTVLDIGANIGIMSVRAARRLADRGRVIAFEPHPVRFEYLSRNLALNHVSNVVGLRYALGDHEGEAVLHDVDPRLGPRRIDATMTAVTGGAAFRVSVRTADDVLAELASPPDVRLVKLDVEGYEPQVLKGMRKTLQQRPVVIFEALNGQALQAVVRCLPSAYRIRQLDDHNYVAQQG